MLDVDTKCVHGHCWDPSEENPDGFPPETWCHSCKNHVHVEAARVMVLVDAIENNPVNFLEHARVSAERTRWLMRDRAIRMAELTVWLNTARTNYDELLSAYTELAGENIASGKAVSDVLEWKRVGCDRVCKPDHPSSPVLTVEVVAGGRVRAIMTALYDGERLVVFDVHVLDTQLSETIVAEGVRLAGMLYRSWQGER